MKSNLLVFLVLGLPLLIFIWHSWKISGARPDGYKPIQDRPVIPAVVIDVDMPFASMVVFLFKVALAAIPALVMLVIVMTFFFGAMMAGMTPGLRY